MPVPIYLLVFIHFSPSRRAGLHTSKKRPFLCPWPKEKSTFLQGVYKKIFYYDFFPCSSTCIINYGSVMYYQSMKKNIWMQIFFITISSTRVTRELSFTIFSFVDLSQILLALSFLKDQIMCTGWFKANLDTLTYYYDKSTMCTEKNHDRFILSLSGHFIW